MSADAVERFLDEVALLVVDVRSSAGVSTAAAELLAIGWDSPRLRELAGEPSTLVWEEIAPLLRGTLAELRLSEATLVRVEAVRRVLRLQCERHLVGELTARELAGWVTANHEWGVNPLIDGIMVLDDDLDDLESLGSDWSGSPRQAVYDEITAAARAILATRSTSS